MCLGWHLVDIRRYTKVFDKSYLGFVRRVSKALRLGQVKPPAGVTEMVEATWVNVGGVWGVKVVGAAKEGDQIMVRKRTGSATLQTLGQQLAENIFAKAGKVSQVRQRAWRSLAATIEQVYSEDISAGADAHARDWDDFRD